MHFRWLVAPLFVMEINLRGFFQARSNSRKVEPSCGQGSMPGQITQPDHHLNEKNE